MVHWSEVFSNVATGVAVLVGGGLAIWNWWLAELLRSRREFPALDGELSWQIVDKSYQGWHGTLNALWRNRSPKSISLHTERSEIILFEVGPDDIEGRRIRPEREPEARIFPISHHESYWLEPNTESIMREHLCLESDKLYFLVWTVRRKRQPDKYWSRSLLVSTKCGDPPAIDGVADS